MKKVIYINYMKQFGHINFDQIHINALLEQGYDVKVVMHHDVAQKMKLQQNMYALILPAFLGHEYKSAVANRLLYILTLIYIKLHINFSRYDYCIISNIDEITLSFVPLTKKMYLFCHDNSRDLDNKIKLFFLKHLSHSHVFLVFNKDMKQPFKKKYFDNIHVISHGCIPPFAEPCSPTKYDKLLNAYDFIVFHPSPKADTFFLKEIYSKENNEILKRNNTLLLLRNNPFKDKNYSNIKFINSYLETIEYQNLFKKANIILLAYPINFQHKVSGVSFECIANQKNLLVLHNHSFDYCKTYYNYSIFFNSADEAIQKIIKMKNNHNNYKCIITAKDLIPNYSDFLQ